MIVSRFYEDLSVLHDNTLPARAYYIPASEKMNNLIEHREESDRLQLLNGNWKFIKKFRFIGKYAKVRINFRSAKFAEPKFIQWVVFPDRGIPGGGRCTRRCIARCGTNVVDSL